MHPYINMLWTLLHWTWASTWSCLLMTGHLACNQAIVGFPLKQLLLQQSTVWLFHMFQKKPPQVHIGGNPKKKTFRCFQVVRFTVLCCCFFTSLPRVHGNVLRWAVSVAHQNGGTSCLTATRTASSSVVRQLLFANTTICHICHLFHNTIVPIASMYGCFTYFCHKM